MSKKLLIIGINGFIGSTLLEKVLAETEWEIYGLDIQTSNIEHLISAPRFTFKQGDMTQEKEWIETNLKNCDAVLPLAAIATPSTYVQDPLRIFELDFEANLDIVRLCVKHNKRVIFPSTSEVYGMCTDEEFDEENSNLVQGPIKNQRWIYSCSKQLMDRIIYAYGIHNNLRYTLFRPFNWIGPKQDNILNKNKGGSRVLTQFIGNIFRGENISLVNGGKQRRSFCYIDDGIDALIKIIENKADLADQQIFNIGNPESNYSIRELATNLLDLIKTYPEHANTQTQLVDISADDYYGKGYEDVSARVPKISNAFERLDWQPKVGFVEALKLTLEYYT